MGFLDSLKRWLSSEASEARDLGQDTKRRLETELDRREAELAATPEERMAMLQEQIAQGDETFEELQAKIEGRGALADATEEVAGLDRTDGDDPTVLDLDSEEVDPPEPPPAS